jgi:hypothetical protein
VSKPRGTKNFTDEEAVLLADLAARGLTKAEAAKALGRSYWTVMRHSRTLGIVFVAREVERRVSRQVPNSELIDARAQRRQLEDQLIKEFARSGWSIGLAAAELDLDFSQLMRHSKRLGVTWTRYPGRSIRGGSVSGLPGLRRLRDKIKVLQFGSESIRAPRRLGNSRLR